MKFIRNTWRREARLCDVLMAVEFVHGWCYESNESKGW